MHPSHRTNVLRAYRELLNLIHRLPAQDQQKALQEARELLTKNKNISNAVEASDKLKELVARISFLRIMTPRRPGEKSRIGAGTFVLRDGELVEGKAMGVSRYLVLAQVALSPSQQYLDVLPTRSAFLCLTPSLHLFAELRMERLAWTKPTESTMSS
jgi:hypothetical protein